MRGALLAALSIALGGCAGVGSLRDGLQPFVGQDIHAAVDVLGYPDGKREMLGDTIYYWSTSHSAPLLMPTTSTTTATAGTTTVIASTHSTQPVTGLYHCTIQMAVDTDNRIKSYQVSGNNGGCASYSRTVSRATGR